MSPSRYGENSKFETFQNYKFTDTNPDLIPESNSELNHPS